MKHEILKSASKINRNHLNGFDCKDCKDYHGAGRAWAAISDNKIVAIRYMGQSLCVASNDPIVFKLANKKRVCKATVELADKISRENFVAYRTRAKVELAELGTVVSGMCSSHTFYIL